MSACDLDEYGTYCKTHRCGAFEDNCRQVNCPHCTFIKPPINEVILNQLAQGLIEMDCS